MIGTHNTMTYLRAKNALWETIKGYWRCQDKTLDEQIALGVRWFDIRVVCDNRLNGNLWNFAHGLITLRGDILLNDVLEKIQTCGGFVRVMLERGVQSEEDLFVDYFAVDRISGKWPCIKGVVIKKGWRILWQKDVGLNLVDCSYVPYKRDTPWYKQLKTIIGFPFKSIKARAKGNKKDFYIRQQDNKHIYVYDFV